MSVARIRRSKPLSSGKKRRTRRVLTPTQKYRMLTRGALRDLHPKWTKAQIDEAEQEVLARTVVLPSFAVKNVRAKKQKRK